MAEKEILEQNELIATRIPPGDNWELVIDQGTTIEGLVMALTMYMRKTKFKGHYRLEPLTVNYMLLELKKLKSKNQNQ